MWQSGTYLNLLILRADFLDDFANDITLDWDIVGTC